MPKARKSIAKRFRVTRKGKILHRHSHLSHFRANKPSDFSRLRRKVRKISRAAAEQRVFKEMYINR